MSNKDHFKVKECCFITKISAGENVKFYKRQ